MATHFLQAIVALTGIAAAVILIRLPLTEGRAANLDLFSIYSDPFVLYGYATSIVFFVALYKTFKLLGCIRQNRAFTPSAISMARDIRYCAIAFGILMTGAGLLIALFHHPGDDPAGFFALCIATVFISVVIAFSVYLFEQILREGTKS
jgi:hypothetical protein